MHQKNLVSQSILSLQSFFGARFDVRTISVLVALTILIGLSACTRGEYKSVDSLLEIAQERYQQAFEEHHMHVPEGLEIANLYQQLLSLAAQNNSSGESQNAGQPAERSKTEPAAENLLTSAALIAEELSALTSRASFTNRPPMTELVKQYRAVAAQQNTKLNFSQQAGIKLLVSRTLNLLAGELSTTAFQLS